MPDVPVVPPVVVEEQVVVEQKQDPQLPPKVMATLETISFAEGTWDSIAQKPDYTVRFSERPGRGTLDTTAPHPLYAKSSWNYTSNASGAYQFLCTTWKHVNGGKNVIMSQENQDAAAVRLIEQKTYYDFNRPFKEQAHRLAYQWSSIPNKWGYSMYGQPVKHINELDRFYQSRVRHWNTQTT